MIFFSYCFREKLTTIAQYLVTFCCCCRLNGVHFVVFYDFSVCLFVSGFWSFRWTHTFCLIRMIARARAQTNNLFVSFAFFFGGYRYYKLSLYVLLVGFIHKFVKICRNVQVLTNGGLHNQRSRYQRTNQKHQLKRKCVTHKSAVTIDNNIFRFDRVDLWPMTFGHGTRMMFVTAWISSNSNRKPHSYLSLENSSKCSLFFYFSLSFSIYLCSKRTQRGSTGTGLRQLNRSMVRQPEQTHAHIRTRYSYNTHSNGDVLFTSQHSRCRFTVYLWNFVGRSMSE